MEISNFTDRELREYEADMKYLDDYNATIAYAKRESFGEGEKSGFGKGIMQTARNMLSDGVKPTLVARYTNLPIKQIKAMV